MRNGVKWVAFGTVRGGIATKALGYRVVPCGVFVRSVIRVCRSGQRELAVAVQWLVAVLRRNRKDNWENGRSLGTTSP